MNEYRIDIKVRNNLILSKIEENGYKSIPDFCKKNDINMYTLYLIINMKCELFRKNGEWISTIIKAAECLNCFPEDFFTETQLHAILKTNKKTILTNEAEMKFLLNNSQKLLEDIVDDNRKDKEIHKSIELLTPREQKVINMRFGIEDGIEHDLKEIGEILSVSGQRVRQIEAKALRKMRHPRIAKKLEVFCE
jgi:RNA polymerase sigma factor (sigma-70 family)